MSVSLVPAVHIFGCGCEVCCSQMSPPSLSSSHLWDLQCGEAPESLNTQTGVDQWWFGSQSHCIPYCAWWAHHCQGLLKHSGGPWFKHCTLPCISMITHQYTNQDLWQKWKWSWIFWATLGVFWRTVFFSTSITLWPGHLNQEEWLKIPLATVKDFYLPFPRWICHKRILYTIPINYLWSKTRYI